MTLDDLKTMLKAAAGDGGDGDAFEQDLLERPFADLGYDSLVVLELTSMVEREYALSLDEESVQLASTPGQFLSLVNERIQASAA